jgi:hypothetical protein
MNTQTYHFPLSYNDILSLVKSLTIQDKIRIEKEIEKETLIFRAKQLDAKIKSCNISMDDVIAEISAYRAKKNDE